MSGWVIADSLYNDAAFWCGHLDSLSWYLREAGEDVNAVEMIRGAGMKSWRREPEAGFQPDVLLALDDYSRAARFWDDVKIKIAQVAAVCPVMPWDVRRPDGTLAYSCVISSIPWMVEEARAHGCRAEFMPLAFDTRALVAGMGVKERDIPCLFVGSRGGNHRKREEVLRELGDLVTIAPPTFGRAYFELLARAEVVINPHAEWSRGVTNNMRMFEAAGMGAVVVTDGEWPIEVQDAFGLTQADTPDDFRAALLHLSANRNGRDRSGRGDREQAMVLRHHTYIQRIPRLIEIARSL